MDRDDIRGMFVQVSRHFSVISSGFQDHNLEIYRGLRGLELKSYVFSLFCVYHNGKNKSTSRFSLFYVTYCHTSLLTGVKQSH